MELIALFLLVLSIAFTLYSLSYVSKTKPTKQKPELPPGSTGWPIIGETLEYIRLAKKNCIEKFIFDRQKKYSAKLFKTSYAGEKMVFFCSPEANRFMFANENKLIKAWWPRNISKIFKGSGKLSESKQKELASMRKNVSALFNQLNAMEKNVVIIDSLARNHLETHWIDCEEVAAHSLAKKYTLSISFRLMLNNVDSETVGELEKLFNCIMSGMFALPINIPGTKFNRAIKASKGIREKIEGIVRRRKIEILENNINESLDDESKDLLSLLIMEKIKDNEEVIESEIADMILVYIVAAYDSTSTTITSIIKYLAELPQVYEEVHREQTEIANSRGHEEPLNLDDIKKMIYSWNVVSEVLRLQPTIAGPFREAITDFSFDGFLIPKGWKLHRAVHGTHKNAKYFPEPDKFDPSRFHGNKIVPYSYVPFGGGAHICPGREYARLQILVFIHYLVKTFRWEKVIPDEELIRDPILMPAKRLPIHLYPHQT